MKQLDNNQHNQSNMHNHKQTRFPVLIAGRCWAALHAEVLGPYVSISDRGHGVGAKVERADVGSQRRTAGHENGQAATRPFIRRLGVIMVSDGW